MSDEILDEEHDVCGTKMVRVAADDPINPHDGPAVVCPACLEVVRAE